MDGIGNCIDCIWLEVESGLNVNNGYCHRYPPTHQIEDDDFNETVFIFTGVCNSDWCGEFKRRGVS